MRFLVAPTSLCRNDKIHTYFVISTPSATAQDKLREKSHLSEQ